MPSLKTKTINGSIWNFADSFLNSGILFLVGIILARILSPDDFGLIGMITVLIGLSNVFIDSGFSIWLIRKIDCNKQDYSTAFFFNILVSIIIYFVLYVFASSISLFFNQPQLQSIIKVYSVIIIIDSIAIIPKVLLVKQIAFKKQMIISVISTIVGGSAGIICALNGYGVWSLVYQTISRQSINSLLLWITSRWYPSLNFSMKSFIELFRFGYKLLLSGLINSLQNNVYYLVIAKYFSPASLGFYTRAEQFNAVVLSSNVGPIEKVFFPSLSLLQNDIDRLNIAVKKTIKVSFLINSVLLLGLAAVSKSLIFILIGTKWESSVLMLQLFCISTISYPINAISINILKIKGRSDLILKAHMIYLLMLIPNILIGIFGGIISLLVSKIIFSGFICTWIYCKYLSYLIEYTVKEQLCDIIPIFIDLVIALFPVYLLSFVELNPYIQFALQIIISITLLYFILERKKRTEYLELKEIISNFVKKISATIVNNDRNNSY